MAVRKKTGTQPALAPEPSPVQATMDQQPDSNSAAANPPRAADSFIGKTVGNCEIIEKINEGGTANIYRGHNVRFNLDRVIKVLKPSLTLETEFFERFRQEAQLTARLDHPNILRVYDTGEVDGYFYIEMEEIAGQSLREYIHANNRIHEREVLSIALQIAQALSYAHSVEISAPGSETIHGILHRDIKPENIMITPGKQVKLMDFGAAKPLNITSSTMQGMIVGTFHYMSPEQLKGENLDARSDFFSLGIVLYELYTGCKPFAGENLTDLIEKITSCRYRRVRDLRRSISPRAEELIDTLLSRSPKHRPSSARRIEEDIQVCLQALSSWSQGRRAHMPVSLRRSLPAVSLVVSCLALLVSSASFLFYGRLPAATLAYPRTAASAPTRAVVQPPAVSSIEKGKQLEAGGAWKEAVALYAMVPSAKEGGLANEYLEAQIRLASLTLKNLGQLTKARSILEKLRIEYSDPAIDGYLGEIYFAQALYSEARERLEAALGSNRGSVIPLTPEFRGELLYHQAKSLDRQYVYIEKSPTLLMEAIKAWNYYLEFAECVSAKTEWCRYAQKRVAELGKIDRKAR